MAQAIGGLLARVAAAEASIAAVQTDIAALQAVAFTRETIDTPFAIGNSPAWVTVKTFTIAASTSRALSGFVLLTGGSMATPTSGVIALGGTNTVVARRPSAGAPTLNGLAAVVGGTITALAAQVVVSGNDIVLQARATGGPSVTATLFYRWEIDTPG